MNEVLATKQRFPSWKQALVILCSGVVLALSSCAMFLSAMFGNTSGILPAVYAAGFVLGAIAAIVGCVLMLIRAIRGPRPKS